MVCGDNVGLAPGERFSNAEEAHDVRPISMEVLAARVLVTHPSHIASRLRKHIPSVGSIDTDSVGLCRILSKILHMTEDVATTVLACEVSQVSAEPHVCGCAFTQIPLADRDAFEQEEAFAIDQFLPQRVKSFRKFWQRKVRLRDYLIKIHVGMETHELTFEMPVRGNSF